MSLCIFLKQFEKLHPHGSKISTSFFLIPISNDEFMVLESKYGWVIRYSIDNEGYPV